MKKIIVNFEDGKEKEKFIKASKKFYDKRDDYYFSYNVPLKEQLSYIIITTLTIIIAGLLIWLGIRMPRHRLQKETIITTGIEYQVVTGNQYIINTKNLPPLNTPVYYMIDGSIKNDARLNNVSMTNEGKLQYHVCRETKNCDEISQDYPDICIKESSRRDEDCSDTFFIGRTEAELKGTLCN